MNSIALRFLGFGLGVLLLFHGLDKIMHGTAVVEKLLIAQKIPYSEYIQYAVYIGEVLAPILLIVGKYMRVAGVIVALNMIVVIFLAHQESLLTLDEHGAWSIEIPVLYLIMALSVALWDKDKQTES